MTIKTLGICALIVVAAFGLALGMLTLAPLAFPDSSDHLQQAREHPSAAPMIIVAPKIDLNPSSRWPLLVEIGPPQWVPPGSTLLIRGLPPAVTLSEGRQVSVDAWAVPVLRLPRLRIDVAAGASGRSDLALTLIGADGGFLAKARMALSINEPKGAPSRELAGDLSPAQRDAWGLNLAPPARRMDWPENAQFLPTQDPSPVHATPAASQLLTPLAPANPNKTELNGQPADQRPPATTSSSGSVAPTPSAPATPPQAPAVSPAAAARAAISGPSAGSAPSGATADAPNPQRRTASQEAKEGELRQVKAASFSAPVPAQPLEATVPGGPPLSGPQSRQAQRIAVAGEDRRRLEGFIARGERNLADGNVAAARQFFQRAAEAGVASGALLLASTYDPHELGRLGVHGVLPNPAIARKWYRRAQELGAPEADRRLMRLGVAD